MTEDFIPIRRAPYPTIRQAWLLFLLVIAMNLGGSFLIVPFQSWNPNLGFFLAYTVGMAAAYFVGRQLQTNTTGLIPDNFQVVNWRIYPILLPAVWASLVLLMPIIELYPPPEWIEEMFEGVIDPSSIWAFLSLVVAAPIFEELIFRGIFLEGFLQRYSPRKSILWASFFFGLVHMNPWQFVTAMGLGIFIGWVYYRTRSLLPCIAIHAFANGTSFFLAGVMTEEQSDMTLLETVGGIGSLLLTILVAGLVLYAAIRLLDNLLPQPQEQLDAPLEAHLIDPEKNEGAEG